MNWKKSVILKSGIIGLIAGIIIWTANNILGRIPGKYLGDFSGYLLITPDLFGLIPCGRTCWIYFDPITLIEIVIICTIAGLTIGTIRSKIKG